MSLTLIPIFRIEYYPIESIDLAILAGSAIEFRVSNNRDSDTAQISRRFRPRAMFDTVSDLGIARDFLSLRVRRMKLVSNL